MQCVPGIAICHLQAHLIVYSVLAHNLCQRVGCCVGCVLGETDPRGRGLTILLGVYPDRCRMEDQPIRPHYTVAKSTQKTKQSMKSVQQKRAGKNNPLTHGGHLEKMKTGNHQSDKKYAKMVEAAWEMEKKQKKNNKQFNIHRSGNMLSRAETPLFFLLSYPGGKKLRQGVPRRFSRVHIEVHDAEVAEDRQGRQHGGRLHYLRRPAPRGNEQTRNVEQITVVQAVLLLGTVWRNKKKTKHTKKKERLAGYTYAIKREMEDADVSQIILSFGTP